MTIDTKKIESLLEEKKFDEAREMIESVFAEELTDKDRAQMTIGFLKMYTDVMNSIDAKYEDALKKAISGLESLNAFQSKLRDEIKMDEVKQSLA